MKTSLRHRPFAMPKPKFPRLSVRHLFTQPRPDAAVSDFLQSLLAHIQSLQSAPDLLSEDGGHHCHEDSACAKIVAPSDAGGLHHADSPCAEIVVPLKSGGHDHVDSAGVEIARPQPLLQLHWLMRAVDLAIQEHKAALELIPSFQSPLSIGDEAWMNVYMNQTAIILDACNAFSAQVSDLEHDLLHIRYAVHVLFDAQKKGLNQEKWLRARKAMQDSLESWKTGRGMAVGDEKNKRTDCLTTVEEMCRGLVAPSEKALARGQSFLLALYGANAVAVFVFVVLALTFSPDDKLLSINLGISNDMQWSMPLNNLLQMAKTETIQSIEGGFKLCLWEFLILKDTVVAVLDLLDSTDGKVALAEQKTELLASHIQSLSKHVDVLMHGLESLGKKLNSLFQAVVKSRSALLDKVGNPQNDV